MVGLIGLVHFLHGAHVFPAGITFKAVGLQKRLGSLRPGSAGSLGKGFPLSDTDRAWVPQPSPRLLRFKAERKPLRVGIVGQVLQITLISVSVSCLGCGGRQRHRPVYGTVSSPCCSDEFLGERPLLSTEIRTFLTVLFFLLALLISQVSGGRDYVPFVSQGLAW